MFRRGFISARGTVLGGRKKKRFVDRGGITSKGPRSSRRDPDPVPVQTCDTTPEEDARFVKELMEEFVEDYVCDSISETEESDVEMPIEPEPEETEKEELDMDNTYYVVIDFEATCFKSKRVSRSDTEIIEFAAVLVDKRTMEVVDEFDMFVRPVIYPKLDKFCTELTSITQEEVDGGYTFPTVLRQFTNWMQQYPGLKTFCAWGDYDRSQLRMECERNNLDYPFDDEYINVKKLFSELKGYKRKYGVSTALKRLKLDFEGTPHRGIDDSRNIVRIMKAILTEPS